nr:MAG: DeoR family transcriptional regulator [Bacillota bacterium]
MNSRQIEILNIIARESKINVNELAKLFNVSQVTIRNDLRYLEKQGMLKRVHGGAVAVTDDNIANRLCLNYKVKKKIAREASKLVRDGETVMIESGSTAAILAKELANKKVTIITNSLFIANYVKDISDINVILLGGFMQKTSEVLVGPLVKASLTDIYVDKLFVGVDGFTKETGFTSLDLGRTEAVRYMREKANRTIVITDSSKFGIRGNVHLLDLEEVDTIITDSEIGQEYVDYIKSNNVNLIMV